MLHRVIATSRSRDTVIYHIESHLRTDIIQSPQTTSPRPALECIE